MALHLADPYRAGLCPALKELAQEGGVSARYQRYRNNQRRLVAGMRALGFRPLLDDSLHSPIITAFIHRMRRSIAFTPSTRS